MFNLNKTLIYYAIKCRSKFKKHFKWYLNRSCIANSNFSLVNINVNITYKENNSLKSCFFLNLMTFKIKNYQFSLNYLGIYIMDELYLKL
jgi:hypothetical protein